MLAIRTIKRTSNNKLLINIPDELNNKDLEIIILPLKKSEKIKFEFWNEEEIEQLSKINLGTPINDDEDYSKW